MAAILVAPRPDGGSLLLSPIPFGSKKLIESTTALTYKTEIRRVFSDTG